MKISSQVLTMMTKVCTIIFVEVIDALSIANLLKLCREEVFSSLKIRYISDLWVWVPFKSESLGSVLVLTLEFKVYFLDLELLIISLYWSIVCLVGNYWFAPLCTESLYLKEVGIFWALFYSLMMASVTSQKS